MGRAATGVWGMDLEKDDLLVAIEIVNPQATLLVAGENGVGKRTEFEEYRRQSRGGKGIITMATSEKTGHVVGALSVTDTDEIMLTTAGGQTVRCAAVYFDSSYCSRGGPGSSPTSSPEPRHSSRPRPAFPRSRVKQKPSYRAWRPLGLVDIALSEAKSRLADLDDEALHRLASPLFPTRPSGLRPSADASRDLAP